MIKIDYHTHNGFYRGTNEQWTIEEGWNIASSKNIKLLGISPKLESKEQDFIKFLRNELNSIENNSIYLGIELDISDPNGNTFLLNKNYNLLDFIMAGPHQMPDKTIVWKDIDKEDLEEYFDLLENIIIKSLSKNRIDILAHPFLQEIEISANMYWKEFIKPLFLKIADLCERKKIALEINENYFRKKDCPKESCYLWNTNQDYYFHKIQVLEEMFSIANSEFDVLFTFGSDTHYLKNVGDINESIEFAKKIGIKEDRLLILNKK